MFWEGRARRSEPGRQWLDIFMPGVNIPESGKASIPSALRISWALILTVLKVENHQSAALVLVGHGSTVNAESSNPVRQLVAEFERRNAFARVSAGFLMEAPRVSTVLESITDLCVFVVPFFVSEGYFTEEVVPLKLGFRIEGQQTFERVQRRGEQTLFYCHPIGTHDRMTEVILSRARSVANPHSRPPKPSEAETTLFIAGHGTSRNAESRQAVERQVGLIRELGCFADVFAVFLEEEPRIGDWYKLVRTRHSVVVPFFLSDGLHVCDDIPALLGKSEPQVQDRLDRGQPVWSNPTQHHGKWIWLSSAVGTDSIVAEVILARVREAAAWQPKPV